MELHGFIVLTFPEGEKTFVRHAAIVEFGDAALAEGSPAKGWYLLAGQDRPNFVVEMREQIADLIDTQLDRDRILAS